MTQYLTTTDCQSPQRPPDRSGYIAWAVILLAVAIMVAMNVEPELHGRKPSSGTSDMQIEMSAKYSIGVRALLSSPVGPIVQQIDTLAKTPQQQVRVAIVAGELDSAESCLKRLDAIDLKSIDPELVHDITVLPGIYTDGPAALSSADRERLISRYGFFGRLALSYKQPDSDPLRQSVLKEGKREAIILMSAVVLGGTLALAGLVLLIIGIVFLATGTIRTRYAPRRGSGTVYVEMFAVYIASMVGFILLQFAAAAILKFQPSLAWSWVLSIVLPIAIAWGMMRGVSWSELRDGLGWHAGRGLHIELPLGIVGYIAGLPVVIVGFAITYALLKLSGVTPSHPIQAEGTDSLGQILQLYGIACIWAPVIEETMFRGALFHHMRRRWNWIISAGVVALIFAAIHPQGWTFIPVLGAIAIVLAGLREWRGSIVPSMVAHACNNFMMVSLLLALK